MKIRHAIALPFLLAGTVFAATPDDLTYDGKPIDSLCFAPGESHVIDLKNCGLEHEKYKSNGPSADMKKKGYVGYEWKDTATEAQGYTYYKYFDAGNHKYWFYTINNTGGSGDFTSIYLVERKDKDTLSLESVAGGDRCNGGVQDVVLKNGVLNYNVNLTPYDIIAQSNKKLPNVQAYDDLAACAACCAATAAYTVTADNTVKFDHITLDKTMKTDEMPTQGKYQSCFNELFASVSKKSTELDQAKVDDFTSQFEQTCVKK
jgi:hypothetical protein